MPSLALPKASTTTTSYPPTGMASEAGLSPETLHLMRCLCALWRQIKTISGVRRGVPLYGDDGARGVAIYVMIEGHDIATGGPMVTPSPMTPALMSEAVTHLVRVVTSA